MRSPVSRVRRAARTLRLAACLAVPVPAGAQAREPFAPLQYLQPDGALTVFRDGLFVEPYFAARALLSARDAGLDVSDAGRRYIAWHLERVAGDASPARYCREAATAWRRCGAADADDAALALWSQLLETSAGPDGMPASWRRASAAALARLERLRDPSRGVYRVSPTLDAALVMDNVEIAAALDAIAGARARRGERGMAQAMRARAIALHHAIDRTFWDDTTRRWRVSTQARPASSALYPDQVAQLYPVLFGHASPADGDAAAARYAAWHRANAAAWLATGSADYPWGLIALGALRMRDTATAACWLAAALPLRQSPQWNLLEEAAAQAVGAVVAPARGAPPPCQLPSR
jgi:hypothetical protein